MENTKQATKPSKNGETEEVTVEQLEQIMPFGPSVRSLLASLEDSRHFDPDDDDTERNMTVQFNVAQHAQLERLAEYYRRSKTSVASDLLQATIVDVFRALDLPQLTPQEIGEFIARTAKKRSGEVL